MNVKESVPFRGTAEQAQELSRIIAQIKNEKGALMPIMQKAQEIYGYLPIEVQQMISDQTGVPLAKIFGIATFYSMFHLHPKGEHKISVCLGTACYVKGSGDVFDALRKELGIEGGECTQDRKFSLDDCRCVGACGLAPVMLIDDEVYARVSPASIKSILAKY